MHQPADLAGKLAQKDRRYLARAISMVENESKGWEALLTNLTFQKKPPVIGITGPPGAGKSTLINAFINFLTRQDYQIGVVAVDPTSPFNDGSLLGDRIRMTEHYNNPSVYIRSLATRGALGGISAKSIEVIDLMKAADFDYIFVETVGVGQSEVEIAGLADTTLVVSVPESGDDIQTIKSGLMEIADIFVVNKADRPHAEGFINALKKMVHAHDPKQWQIQVIPTVAAEEEGLDQLYNTIQQHHEYVQVNEKQPYLLAEKAYKLIQHKRMKNISKDNLVAAIQAQYQNPNFNLYAFVEQFKL